MLEGIEQLQIQALQKEGLAPSEMAAQGLTAAVEPKVY